jgi:hypothetical protein
MEIVDISSLLASPRTVRIIGVPNPSGAVLAKIKDGMRLKCKSEIFSDALNAGMEDDIKDNLKRVIQSVIDSNILELLGQCLPETCPSAIIDRAYRNELVTQLFPFKVRDSLSKTIRNGVRNAIMHLFYVDEISEGEIPSRHFFLSC